MKIELTKQELALIHYACDLALCDMSERHQKNLSNVMRKVSNQQCEKTRKEIRISNGCSGI